MDESRIAIPSVEPSSRNKRGLLLFWNADVPTLLGLFAIVVLLTHYISLGSILAAAAFPFVVYLVYRNQYPAAAYAIISVSSLLIIWRHRSNIQRLIAGTENRFPSGKATEGKA